MAFIKQKQAWWWFSFKSCVVVDSGWRRRRRRTHYTGGNILVENCMCNDNANDGWLVTPTRTKTSGPVLCRWRCKANLANIKYKLNSFSVYVYAHVIRSYFAWVYRVRQRSDEGCCHCLAFVLRFVRRTQYAIKYVVTRFASSQSPHYLPDVPHQLLSFGFTIFCHFRFEFFFLLFSLHFLLSCTNKWKRFGVCVREFVFIFASPAGRWFFSLSLRL